MGGRHFLGFDCHEHVEPCIEKVYEAENAGEKTGGIRNEEREGEKRDR